MLGFIGLGQNELAILLVLYFLILSYTFYYVLNENTPLLLRVSKACVAIFIPVFGIALVWSEIFFRKVVFNK